MAKAWNSTLNRGTSQLSRANADNLKRSGFKNRGEGLKRDKPMKRRKKPHPWKDMLSTIYSRATGRCERCKRRILRDEASPSNCHHIRPRGAGGSDEPENLAFLCSSSQFWGREDHSCHTWAHAHPIESRREGWTK